MSKFEKGKPKTGGKVKGTKNKATIVKQLKLEEALSQAGVQVGTHLAEAIKDKNIDLIKALATILPFVTPKLGPIAEGVPLSPADDLPNDEATLLTLVKPMPASPKV